MKKILIGCSLMFSILFIGTSCNNNADTSSSTKDTTSAKDTASSETEMSQPH